MRARSTRLAGSVRERAAAFNFLTSSSLSANANACRHPAMTLLPATRISQRRYKPCPQKLNPAHMIAVTESMN